MPVVLWNLSGIIEEYGLADQPFPDHLRRGEDESLLAWRDRLFHIFRIPIPYAVISDIKFSYMEQISPLLSRMILDRARELPDRLRSDKFLYARIIKTFSPGSTAVSPRAGRFRRVWQVP